MRMVSNIFSKLKRFSTNTAKPILAHSCIALFLLFIFTSKAVAETRLYHLRVTLRNGERYETISTYDPINYCHMNGGSVVCYRGYSLVFSPEMKVKVLRTWIEARGSLRERFNDLLQTHRMLAYANHKALPRANPLALRDMRQPE